MSITDEEMQALLQQSRTYTLVVLKPGPNIGAADARSVIWEHGKRNLVLMKAGQMPIVCAVNDGTELSGVGVLDLDLEEARRVMDGDPGVRAGIFTYELHTARSFPGSTLPR